MSGARSGPSGPTAVRLVARWRWLKQVDADRELSPAVLKVALALADKVNSAKGYAWPRLAALEEITGLRERGIRGIVDQLVSRGHLAVKVSRGPGASNRYWLQLQDATDLEDEEPVGADQNRHGGAGSLDGQAEKNRHGRAGSVKPEMGEYQHGHAGEYRHGGDRNTGTAMPPTSYSNRANGPAAALPLGGGAGAGGLADDVRLDPDDPTVMGVVEAIMRDALAAKPSRDACNRGLALRRIRRRLGADRDFSAYRQHVDTAAYLVGDLRRGVAEAVERAKVEPTTWGDLVPWVRHVAGDRLAKTPRPALRQ